jgi:hypothetical protein
MTRVEELSTWQERRLPSVRLIAELAEEPRAIRRRSRTAEEHAMLEHAALVAMERRMAERRLVKLGTRRYALRG